MKLINFATLKSLINDAQLLSIIEANKGNFKLRLEPNQAGQQFNYKLTLVDSEVDHSLYDQQLPAAMASALKLGNVVEISPAKQPDNFTIIGLSTSQAAMLVPRFFTASQPTPQSAKRNGGGNGPRPETQRRYNKKHAGEGLDLTYALEA